MKAIQLYRRHFNTLENRIESAIEDQLAGTFITDDKATATEKVNKYLDGVNDDTYKGWDGRTYPYYFTREIEIQ
jgi:hypothetical protein